MSWPPRRPELTTTPNSSSEKEQELLAVLRSDAPAGRQSDRLQKAGHLRIERSGCRAGKAAARRAVVLVGAGSRWKRFPATAADEALRTATDSLEGRLLVGTINSIGVRRDANAVDLLTTRLQDDDAEVASAAAVALGRIGNAAAAKSLRQSLADAPANVRSAIAEGCVLCAERFLAEGKSVEATEIYDEVRHADVPRPANPRSDSRSDSRSRTRRAFRCCWSNSGRRKRRCSSSRWARLVSFPVAKSTRPWRPRWFARHPSGLRLMIQAMADRPETVVLAAVLKAAEQGDKQVRLSAIDALRRVGDDSCLAVLLEIAIEADADLAETAKETLADLPGENVDAQDCSAVAPMPREKVTRC